MLQCRLRIFLLIEQFPGYATVEINQILTGTPGIRQIIVRKAISTCVNLGGDLHYNLRRTAAEAIDTLLRVSHPVGLFHQLREPVKDVNLRRVGILELVHKDILYTAAYVFLDDIHIQKPEEELLHVIELNESTRGLEIRECLVHLDGKVEHSLAGIHQRFLHRAGPLGLIHQFSQLLESRNGFPYLLAANVSLQEAAQFNEAGV